MVACEDVGVANAGRHRDGQVTEHVCGCHVGFGIADDDGGVVRRDRLADQPRLLKCRIRTWGGVLNRLEKRRECEDRELGAQRRR